MLKNNICNTYINNKNKLIKTKKLKTKKLKMKKLLYFLYFLILFYQINNFDAVIDIILWNHISFIKNKNMENNLHLYVNFKNAVYFFN